MKKITILLIILLFAIATQSFGQSEVGTIRFDNMSILKNYSGYFNSRLTEVRFLYRYGNIIGFISISQSARNKALILLFSSISGSIYAIDEAREVNLSFFDETWGVSTRYYVLERSPSWENYFLMYNRGY